MTNRHRPQLALANDTGPTLALAAPGAALVDEQARTISGLIVPFGPTGQTSMGRLQFSPGSLTWSSPRRVKLLREHAQADSLGFARSLEELDAAEVDRRMAAAGQEPIGLPGIWATWHVPEGENGDRALAEAQNGVRDAFSVGVQLDDKTRTALGRANGAAVQGRGALRETSLVSVPAFDDARVGSVAAHAELVVSSWSNPTHTGEPVRCTTCHHVHAAGVTACLPEHLQAAQAALAAAGAQPPAPAPQPPGPNPAPAPTPAPTDPNNPTQPTTDADPAPVAVAGAAIVTGEPSTYTFDGDGESLALDAWHARIEGNGEAAQRLHRFNAELVDGNLPSQLAVAAVFETDTPGAAPLLAPNVRRPDLMRQAVDRGRPLNSRVPSVPIRNATPFLIPSDGEFDGVDDHTEGTAHVVEGTYTLGEGTLQPRALSGAFRVSREMVDSSNPAIDRLALAAMLRDYRRVSEARLVTAIRATLLDAGVVAGINTVQELRLQLIDFADDETEPDFVLASKGYFSTLVGDVDADGRPMLPFVGPSNAAGTVRAGFTGASIDGVEVVKSSAWVANEALILQASDVLVAESPAQTFRFDEVEGPGIVKLALFGYYGAKLMRAAGGRRIKAAA